MGVLMCHLYQSSCRWVVVGKFKFLEREIFIFLLSCACIGVLEKWKAYPDFSSGCA